MIIATEKAPKAIGPYSQGVEAGGMVFCAGQIPLDPASGALVEGDIRVQAERVMGNLKMVLEAAGCSAGDIVRLDVYLTDLADFPAVNEVLGRDFPKDPPARVTVGVAALPKGARIEIAAIAVKGS